jgi:serine O-acetyltransferase
VERNNKLFENVKQDLRRCGDGTSIRLREVLFNPGTWAVLSYRAKRCLYTRRFPGVVRRPINFLSTLLDLWIKVVTNIELPMTAEIGDGLYIPHTGFIVVATGAKIGRNCTITQGVTIGHAGGGRKDATSCPVIGDRVYIGPSAVVIGPISVGDDALIGAGAIVVDSVPDGGVVVGNPARVISNHGSFDLITYSGAELDEGRMASLRVLRPKQPAGVPNLEPH